MKPALRLVNEKPRGIELRDPVSLYLMELSKTGQRTMLSKLHTLMRLLGLRKIEARNLCIVAFAARGVLSDAGAAPATINATLSALKGIARAAWQLGQLNAEDLERVRDVRTMRGSRFPRGRHCPPDEISAVIQNCIRDTSPAGARDAVIIGLQYNLGLRRAECAALDVMDYFPQSQTLRVRGKGNKERPSYPVDRGFCEGLNAWLRHRTNVPGPLLCPVNRNGSVVIRRLNDQSIYDLLKKRGLAAGVKNFTPHNLRRTFATELLERGVDINIVRILLGHSRLETTAIYDYRDETHKRNATALLTLPYENQRQGLLFET